MERSEVIKLVGYAVIIETSLKTPSVLGPVYFCGEAVLSGELETKPIPVFADNIKSYGLRYSDITNIHTTDSKMIKGSLDECMEIARVTAAKSSMVTGYTPYTLIKGWNTNKYPHICPRCKAPAYIGMNDIDCSRNHHE